MINVICTQYVYFDNHSVDCDICVNQILKVVFLVATRLTRINVAIAVLLVLGLLRIVQVYGVLIVACMHRST